MMKEGNHMSEEYNDDKVTQQEITEIRKMDRMGRLRKSKMIGGIISALLGALLLFWPGLTMGLICQAVGAAISIAGILAVISYFRQSQEAPFRTGSLIAGAVLALTGMYIFLRPALLIEFIPVVLGIIILIDGIINLFETMSLMKQGYSRWWISLIFAVITIIGGFILIMRPFSAAATLMRVIGAVTLYNGLSDIFIASRINTGIKDI